MSFQGSQIRLAFGLNGLNNRELSYEAITTVNYVELNRRLQEEEKLISFSEITWPFIFIQAEANKHIMIDDIGLFNFENQILNSPRTAQIGHVIRKSELNFIEKLNLILEIMRFEKTISLDEEKNPNLESEFLKREIKGLVEPKIIEGLSPIITKTTKFQMSQMESLESLFTFDDALQYAEEYIDVLSEIRGNRHQWKSLLQLIREPVEEHLLELKVEKKDILERYSSQIEKEKKLDEKTIREKINSAKNYADQWMVRKHKNIAQKVGKSFVNIDLTLAEMRKKNKYFMNTDALKTMAIGKVVQRAFKHISYLRERLEKSENDLEEISSNLKTVQDELKQTNISADEKINNVSADLLTKKQLQERRINQLKNERDTQIDEIEQEKNETEQLWSQIQEIINSKIEDCNYDEKQIQAWQLDDNRTNIQTPTVRYFLPIGIGIYEDEFEDEIIKIHLPSFIQPGLHRKHFSRDIKKFERKIERILDRNMKIRSNFEFACERGNLIETSKLQNLLKKGLSELTMIKLISDEEFETLSKKYGIK